MSFPNAVVIVDAAFSDFDAIAKIYSHYVLEEVATFELEAPDRNEMFARARATREKGLPYLAAYLDDKVVGYAYAAEFRSRSAYNLTVENSVYIDKDFKGRGTGRALLEELVKRCAAAGKKQMLAVIAGDEQEVKASVALHTAAGFEHVGVLKGVGFKFDRFVDDILMQRSLAP